MNDTTIKSEEFLITEVPGQQATPEQMSMFYTRYRFLAEYCEGREVLEVACGGGQGLGYLARRAKRVIGGDIDQRIIPHVKRHYRDRENIQVLHLDAQDLKFPDASFDTVAILDAIYWLKDQERFVQEARRVLRPGGVLFITTVNRHWKEFNPSSFATRYLDANDLRSMLEVASFNVEVYAAFNAKSSGMIATVVGALRRVMVKFKLIPSSIRLKALLKSIFVGKLASIPVEVVDAMAPYDAPARVMSGLEAGSHKLIYVVARRA